MELNDRSANQVLLGGGPDSLQPTIGRLRQIMLDTGLLAHPFAGDVRLDNQLLENWQP
jgi:hypothetical protein